MNARVKRQLVSWLWTLIPLYTLGFGTAVMMVHAAQKLKSVLQGVSCLVYVAGLATVLTIDPDHGRQQEFWFGVGMSVNMGLGFVHAALIRPVVFPRSALPVEPDRLVDRQEKVLEAQADQAEARAAARELMASDPLLARQLRIGRPDIANREYPDGGLVDVNQVSADVLCWAARIDPELARQVITVRDQVGGYSSYEDLLMLTEADPRTLEPAADRLAFSRRR